MAQRISKNPVERKRELIDAAEKLFVHNGYEQTSVKDIITSVGVAHGLFYYYFPSKEAILTAIIDRYYESFLENMNPIIDSESGTGLEMFMRMLIVSSSMKKGKEQFFSYIGTTQDPVLQERLSARYKEIIAPTIVSIVKKGVQDGSFDTPYPEESVDAIHACGTALLAPRVGAHSATDLLRGYHAYLEIVERILGIQDHALREFVDSQLSGTDEQIRAFSKALQEDGAHERD